MRLSRERFFYFVRCIFAWGTVITGCATAPQVFTLSSTSDAVAPPLYGSKDYARTMAAIASVMARDFQLPVMDLSVSVYPSQVSYESGVVAAAVRDRERLQQQRGPKAELPTEEEFADAARITAAGSIAVGNYRKVIVNDWRAAKSRWHDWVRLLAHELTHSAEKELIQGRSSSADQWLREGLAEWVGYKIADRFGADNFAESRQRILDRIAAARANQTFPALSQLARNSDWIRWSRTLGRPSTYGQAFIAVDVLIEHKGIEAMIDYFRLFGKLNHRERNFAAAFGEPMAQFEEKFSQRLAALSAG